MIGSIIGGALSAAGGIFGGIAQAKAMRKVKENVENQQKENQNWYDRRYNEDATQRADAQAILTRTEKDIKERNKAAASSQAIMGGTDESLAVAKEANNLALSDATSKIAVNADRRKDAIEDQYMSTKSDINKQLNDIEQKKAANVSEAIKGVTSAATNIAGSF